MNKKKLDIIFFFVIIATIFKNKRKGIIMNKIIAIKKISPSSPLPWTHYKDRKRVSAVLDAMGRVVCGSLISRTSKEDCKNHAYIIECVAKYKPENKK